MQVVDVMFCSVLVLGGGVASSHCQTRIKHMMKLGEREKEQNEMTLIAGVYGMLRKPIVQTSLTILHHPKARKPWSRIP